MMVTVSSVAIRSQALRAIGSARLLNAAAPATLGRKTAPNIRPPPAMALDAKKLRRVRVPASAVVLWLLTAKAPMPIGARAFSMDVFIASSKCCPPFRRPDSLGAAELGFTGCTAVEPLAESFDKLLMG